MKDAQIPELPKEVSSACLLEAMSSKRRRYPKLLHSRGEEFNQVFNFMMRDSYMQPHLHPGEENIERIHLVEGRIGAFFFDDSGRVKQRTLLEKDGIELIEVPAFTWHTYVMLTDHAITYETMMGVYNPGTWKKMADWAPQEGSSESTEYLNNLRREVAEWTR